MSDHLSTLSDYEAIGGASAVKEIVDDFYLRVLHDRQLAPFFEGVDISALRRHQTLLVSKVLGGPDSYDGRTLRDAHVGMPITADDFSRVVTHLGAALNHAGVPAEVISRAAIAVMQTEPDIVQRP